MGAGGTAAEVNIAPPYVPPRAATSQKMRDPARNVLRVAVLQDGVLHAALFLAPRVAQLPQPDALLALLGLPVSHAARPLLLSGRAAAEADTGPHICACFGVTRDAVRHAAVTHRLHSVAEIGLRPHAGTNCGSCTPKLEEILRDVRVPV